MLDNLQLKIRGRLTGGFLTMATLLLVVGGLGYRSLGKVSDATVSVERTTPLADAAMEMRIALSTDKQLILDMLESATLSDLEQWWAQHQATVKLFDAYNDGVLHGGEAEGTMIYAAADAQLLAIAQEAADLHDTQLQPAISSIYDVSGKRVLALAALERERSGSAAYQAVQARIDSLSAEESADHAKADAVAQKLADTLGSLEQRTDEHVDSVRAASRAVSTRARTELLIGMLVGFILALVIGRVTGNTIVNPLAGLTTAAEKLARNDTSIEVPHRNRTDEVGLLARAMETFKQGLIERARLQEEAKAAEEAQRVAEAQRNAEERARDAEATRIREERTSRMEALVGDFDQSVRAILDVVASAATELEATSGGMARLAETAARDVSEATGESRAAAGNVDAVASASEEMARSVREITTQVHRSTERTREAMAAAAAATETVTTLHEDVGRIASVLSLINDIAEQTNLLALNATIEAARAGDAGKGFAVVAAEVKSLANETAKATGNIEAQMGSIQALSDQMAQAVKTIQAVVEDTESIAQGIAAAVEQQDAATAEIARSAQGAAQSTAVASANIEQVARGTAETQAAATQVLGASQELARNGTTMQSVVDDFLRAVRAA